jgi:hypothetical protein
MGQACATHTPTRMRTYSASMAETRKILEKLHLLCEAAGRARKERRETTRPLLKKGLVSVRSMTYVAGKAD